jgi:4-diphosphocytidyl-2-C-methyl-D-erythritol kinase
VPSISLIAPAKLNLTLRVGHPLPAGHEKAGYHPIASWMVPIDLADELTLETPGDGSLAISWAPDAPRPSPIDWPIEKDLARRAHRLVEAHLGRPLPISARLLKRVPVGGGLGGGSSDAAAMIRGLDQLFALQLPETAMHAIAARLGSDVPFFIDGHREIPRPATVTWMGDLIERAPVAPFHAVLVVPEFGCPTGAIYRAFDADLARLPSLPDESGVRALALRAAPLASRSELANDLAEPAMRVEPRLRELLAVLHRETSQTFMVTGSGSCAFALCVDEQESEQIRAVCLARGVLAVHVRSLAET